MSRKERIGLGLLGAACIISLAVPIKGLLIDGVYNWHIRQPEFFKMVFEIVGLALILGAVFLCVKKTSARLGITGGVCLAFIWGHVVFLPMLATGMYVASLILTGHAVRIRFLRCNREMNGGWMWDFLLGCSFMTVLFCLLSVAGVGSIPVLRGAAVLTGVAALALCGPGVRRKLQKTQKAQEAHKTQKIQDKQEACEMQGMKGGDRFANPKFTLPQLFLLLFMLLMLLIQAGRMNISLDFDSLWYGLRPEYILDNGRGIYENMGSVGVVYTYSKGLEVLLLPLSGLSSHSYLIFFNLWMSVFSLAAVYRIGRFYMNRTYALLAAACVSSIPAVMNMSITAKADSMTLVVQLMMIVFLLYYLEEKRGEYLAASLGALFLSWTLKPTALVFSTAVYGMSVLYLVFTRRLFVKKMFEKGRRREWLGLLLPLGALAGIWGRTLAMTGVPVTSVYSSIFTKLGFSLKYPFAVLPLNGNASETGGFHGLAETCRYLAETLWNMFLNPSGEDMSHVVIAWGTSLLFFFCVTVIVGVFVNHQKGSNTYRNGRRESVITDRRAQIESASANDSAVCQTYHLTRYACTVMVPFAAVCLISLTMLGQIDGNYFMLLYTGIVLFGCGAVSQMETGALRRGILTMIIPILLLNSCVTMVSNWAWSLGFTPVELLNKGRMDHKALQHLEMVEHGNGTIWDMLAKDPKTRVIAVGDHPDVFAFPCNVQSYDDITSTWGNVVLVKTMDHFIEYLDYAGTDYIYMQAGYVAEESRCYELMGYLIEAGILTDVYYENGNLLARVDLEGAYGPEASEAYAVYLRDYPVSQ